MIDGPSELLAIVGGVGAGLNAGVFFAFSTFVMAAIGKLPTREGVLVMQEINIEAPRPWFMAVFLGTAAVCMGLAASTFGRLDEMRGISQLVGSGLYLAGVALTVGYHVPRNDALGRLEPDSEAAARAWSTYLPNWTRWNHVRTLTSLSASVVLILSLLVG